MILFIYKVCGLSVVSEIALPLYSADFLADRCDISIRYGSVPDTLDGADYVGPNWQVAKDRLLIKVPRVARILIEAGSSIVVELDHTLNDADVAPFILSTAFAGILHQRQILSLHASTIALSGRAVALCGPSGTGKSTLAATLCNAGWDFVGDDVAPIRFSAGQSPVVAPDGRQHRLWSDAISHLGLSQEQEFPVRGHLDKFHVRARKASVNADRELPLGAIILLTSRPNHSDLAAPDIKQLKPVDAAPLLSEEVYRISLARHMGHEGRIFNQVAGVLAQVPLFKLERTRGMEYLDATAQLVREVLR